MLMIKIRTPGPSNRTDASQSRGLHYHRLMLLRFPKKPVLELSATRLPHRRLFTARVGTMSTTAKVAICQICSTDNVQHNLAISKEIIRQAVGAGAKVSRISTTSQSEAHATQLRTGLLLTRSRRLYRSYHRSVLRPFSTSLQPHIYSRLTRSSQRAQCLDSIGSARATGSGGR